MPWKLATTVMARTSLSRIGTTGNFATRQQLATNTVTQAKLDLLSRLKLVLDDARDRLNHIDAVLRHTIVLQAGCAGLSQGRS